MTTKRKTLEQRAATSIKRIARWSNPRARVLQKVWLAGYRAAMRDVKKQEVG